MTIKNKIIISSVLLFALFISTGLSGWLGYRYVSSSNDNVLALDKGTMYLQMMLRGVNEIMITEGTKASIDITSNGMNGFDEVYSKLLSDNKDTQLQEILTEKTESKWQNIKEGVKPFMDKYLDTEDDKVQVAYGKLITETELLLKEIDSLLEEASIRAQLIISNTRNIIVIIFAGFLLGIIIISYNLYKSVTSPIRELNQVAEGFSRGDLSILMIDSTKDEFGKLASYFNSATTTLSGMINQVMDRISTVSKSTKELSSSSLQIATVAQDQASKTTRAVSAMEELNTSFIDVAKDTANATESAKEATELAEMGGKVVEETTIGMNKLSQSVNESAQTIEALGKRSEQIGEIIKVINEIADQTNLLALNAAIEAARAGEHGRGFAVVADEVRKLAERTTSSTQEIGDMVKGIQEDTQMAVETMQTGTEEVQTGVNKAHQAYESLKQIVTSVQHVSEMIERIATAAEEQSRTGEEITGNLESVEDSTRQTSDAIENSSGSIMNLNVLAKDLEQLMGGFKTINKDSSSKNSNPELNQEYHKSNAITTT